MPGNRYLKAGAAVLSAAVIGVVCFAHSTTQVTPEAGPVTVPSQFSGVRIEIAPQPARTETKAATHPSGPASQIILDDQGNRVEPQPGQPLPSDELQLGGKGKSGFTYQERTLEGGLKVFIPDNPIRTFSIVEIGEDGALQKHCTKLPESILQKHKPDSEEKGAAE